MKEGTDTIKHGEQRTMAGDQASSPEMQEVRK
jgi:hypothetical protein